MIAVTYPHEFITEGSGDYINDVAGEALTKHALVYRSNADTWLLADADAVATMPVIGITLAAIPSGNKGRILIRGYVADTAWTWITGGSNGKIYASTTPGVLTQTPPSGVDDTIEVVAVAFFSNGIWFDPGGFGAGGQGCAVLPGATAYVGFDDCKEPYANYFVCSGLEDNVQIQAALDYLPDGGGKVLLERGRYDIAGSGDLLTFRRSYTVLSGMGAGESGGTRLTIANGVNYDSVITTGRDFCTIKDLAIHGNRANTTGNGRGIDLSDTIDQTVEKILTYELRGSDIYAYMVREKTWMHFIRHNWLEGAPGGTPCVHYSYNPAAPHADVYNLRDCYFSFNIISADGILLEKHPNRIADYTYQDIDITKNHSATPVQVEDSKNTRIEGNVLVGGGPQIVLLRALNPVITGNPGVTSMTLTNVTGLKVGHNPSYAYHDGFTALDDISLDDTYTLTNFPVYLRQRTGIRVSSNLFTEAVARNNLTIDKIRAAPFLIPQRCTLDRIAIRVLGAGAGGAAIRIGLYDDDGNLYPDNLIVDGGALDATGTGVKEANISEALTPGIYWIAGISNDATIDWQGPSGGGFIPLISDFLFTNCGWIHNQAYGAMPNPFPTASPSGHFEVPMPYYRIASWT